MFLFTVLLLSYRMDRTKDPPDKMDYILSQRGRPLIVVDGYLYRKNRGAYWRCIRCTKFKCKSRLILRADREPVCVEKHSHAPEKEKIEWGRKVKTANAIDDQ